MGPKDCLEFCIIFGLESWSFGLVLEKFRSRTSLINRDWGITRA
uniref:Uncharacterized protein n=1 Tax=Meloidogyne enterolobii TaxID=390850 RepID=A0A6V7W1Y8_MELEN|nr:unnamed protein product [Meloidogyne enterolobii]